MDMVSMTVMAATALGAFLLSALMGKILIPILHRLKFGQTIREEGPSWHKNKQGTPTMGGFIFIIGMFGALIVAILVCELFLPVKIFTSSSNTSEYPYFVNKLMITKLVGGALLALCSGAIGFADDYIKVIKKRNLGLTSGQKMFAQLLMAAGYAVALYLAGGTTTYVPFVGEVDFGIWFIPFCMFVVVAVVNATNLTDGIDGLLGTVSFVATLFFLVAAGITSHFGQGLMAAAMAGALAGFLLWNLHPAKVFMGDTGSLFIGGVLCAVAFGINCPLLLIPVGIVYIAETLSVMLQVTYFKLTHGKRLFKMSPLHHHFEMCGWSENKIVMVFSFVTLLGCVAAGFLLM